MTIWPGEESAWEILAASDPAIVAPNALAEYDLQRSCYLLNCFGSTLELFPASRMIKADGAFSEIIAGDLKKYTFLAALNYLNLAKNIPLSNRLVRPDDFPGGGIFSKGTHTLPLAELSKKYDSAPERILQLMPDLKARPIDYGDAAIELLPFPRIPVSFIVWEGDDEFPGSASLLFDASCSIHLPTDIIWSVAMLTSKLLLSI